MAKKFEVDYELVRRVQPTIKRPITVINDVENQFDYLRMQLDWAVRNRCNAYENLQKAGNFLVDATSLLHQLDRLVIHSMNEYEKTENYIKGKATELATGWYNPPFWDDTFKVLRGTTIAIGGALVNPHDWLRKNGVQFFLEKRDGKTYIKIGKWNLNPFDLFHQSIDGANWENFRKKLLGSLGTGRHTFSKDDIKALLKEGVAIYDNVMGKMFNKNVSKFSRDAFPELRDALDGFLGKDRFTRAGQAFRNNINPLSDFTGWFGKGVTNLSRVAKLPGIVGIGIDVMDNLDTIRDENGKVSFSGATFEQQKKFVVDTSVDVLSGSAAMATGAAVGSLIAPPVGTVVGAVAGGVIYAGMNWKIFGDDPKKSAVDAIKDGANSAVNGLVDGFRKLDKVFW